MGSLVALLAAWALWAQVHPDDPVRVVPLGSGLSVLLWWSLG
jgi:hypothetical protein